MNARVLILLATLSFTAHATANAQTLTSARQIEDAVAGVSTSGTFSTATAPATSRLARAGDSPWEGVLIGGAIGAVGGMIIAPRALCGSNDSECTVIVRVAVGLPVLAGAMVAGGLIDRFYVRGPVVWRSARQTAAARVGAFPGGGTGVQLTVDFRRPSRYPKE